MTVPLTTTEFGKIRVGRSRVSLDSVVHHYKHGATAERIAESFPSLDLADICAVIAYYLANRELVEEYLRTQEAESDALQQQIESDPNQQKATNQIAGTNWCTLGGAEIIRRFRLIQRPVASC